MENPRWHLATGRVMNFLTLVLILFSSLSFSQASNTLDLQVSAEDIVEIENIVNAKVPFGKNKGMPLNTSIRRPLYVLGAAKGQSKLLADMLAMDTVNVANFYHNGEFYIARLPISKVNSIILLEAPFSTYASHTMLRFETEKDAHVELIAKIKNQPKLRPEDPAKIEIEPLETPVLLKDMVVSIDGTEPLGLGKWNMLDALKGKYTIAYRMVSIPERFRWFLLNGVPIKQTKWKVTPEEAQNTLRRSIEESHNLGFSSPYDLIKANCTNLAIRLVKNSTPYESQNKGMFSSIKEMARKVLDFIIRPTEPLTQFTQFNLQLLGWLEKRQEELQKSPEFRADVVQAVKEFRNSILDRKDLDETQKRNLIHELGVDESMAIVDKPKKFQNAIRAYKKALNNAQVMQDSLSAKGQCLNFYR